MTKQICVSVEKVAKRLKLVHLNPEVSLEGRVITTPDVIRPSFQLTGYFENFAYDRVQVIGYPEYTYMRKMDKETRKVRYNEMLSYETPCYVVTRGLKPQKYFLDCATKHGIPVFSTDKFSPQFVSDLVRLLSLELAPRITIPGVLIDVYGEGVLITGESGIGKSEAALELIRRGHRLVADDAVEIQKMSEDRLVGRAPEITKHLIELRGIGIVDIMTMYGVESIMESQRISFIIHLEEWSKDKVYDRIGIADEYREILGNKVTCYTIPIRPGRNVAIIVETAAVNYRQRIMGFNAAEELQRRLRDKGKK